MSKERIINLGFGNFVVASRVVGHHQLGVFSHAPPA